MFGELPATGFFARHVKNLEMTNVEIATEKKDARPAFWFADVQGVDLFRVRVPSSRPVFGLNKVTNFRIFGSQFVPDKTLADADSASF
jgi:hypothetical protein